MKSIPQASLVIGLAADSAFVEVIFSTSFGPFRHDNLRGHGKCGANGSRRYFAIGESIFTGPRLTNRLSALAQHSSDAAINCALTECHFYRVNEHGGFAQIISKARN
jgi:hypothetical protein